jgi:hypothetical protein
MATRSQADRAPQPTCPNRIQTGIDLDCLDPDNRRHERIGRRCSLRSPAPRRPLALEPAPLWAYLRRTPRGGDEAPLATPPASRGRLVVPPRATVAGMGPDRAISGDHGGTLVEVETRCRREAVSAGGPRRGWPPRAGTVRNGIPTCVEGLPGRPPPDGVHADRLFLPGPESPRPGLCRSGLSGAG